MPILTSEAKGQQTMAESVPVVVASDQSDIPVTLNGEEVTISGSVLPAGASTAALQEDLNAVTIIRDIGSETINGNGASQDATVPEGTKAVFVSSDYVNIAIAAGEDGYAHLGINRAASAETSPVVYPRGYVAYNLDDDQTLAVFATANTKVYLNYLGDAG